MVVTIKNKMQNPSMLPWLFKRDNVLTETIASSQQIYKIKATIFLKISLSFTLIKKKVTVTLEEMTSLQPYFKTQNISIYINMLITEVPFYCFISLSQLGLVMARLLYIMPI